MPFTNIPHDTEFRQNIIFKGTKNGPYLTLRAHLLVFVSAVISFSATILGG